MKLIFALLAGTFFFSALLTPWVYYALLMVWPSLPWPFSRIYDRVAMVVVGILVIVYRKHFDLNMVKENLKSDSKVLPLIIGFLLTLFASVSVFALLLLGPMFAFKERGFSETCIKLAVIIFSALIISLLEETFFRGILFRKLLEKRTFAKAAILSSLAYAVVHFISPIKKFEVHGLEPISGFVYTSKLFTRLLNIDALAGMIGLFLVGLVLCHVFYKTKNLYLCIGLHAGWVASVKLGLYLLKTTPGMNFPVAVGQRYFFVSQPVTWISIIAVWGIFLFLRRLKMFSANACKRSTEISI